MTDIGPTKISSRVDSELARRTKESRAKAVTLYPAKPLTDRSEAGMLQRAEQRLDQMRYVLASLSGKLSHDAPQLSAEIYAVAIESFETGTPTSAT